MSQHYKQVIFDKWTFDDMTICGIDGCNKSVDESWRQWVTVQGREKLVPFCSKHGPIEAQEERLFKLGF